MKDPDCVKKIMVIGDALILDESLKKIQRIPTQKHSIGILVINTPYTIMTICTIHCLLWRRHGLQWAGNFMCVLCCLQYLKWTCISLCHFLFGKPTIIFNTLEFSPNYCWRTNWQSSLKTDTAAVAERMMEFHYEYHHLSLLTHAKCVRRGKCDYSNKQLYSITDTGQLVMTKQFKSIAPLVLKRGCKNSFMASNWGSGQINLKRMVI